MASKGMGQCQATRAVDVAGAKQNDNNQHTQTHTRARAKRITMSHDCSAINTAKAVYVSAPSAESEISISFTCSSNNASG